MRAERVNLPVYALLIMLHEWSQEQINNPLLLMLFLIDYQKAFDHINHNIVLHKLKSF